MLRAAMLRASHATTLCQNTRCCAPPAHPPAGNLANFWGYQWRRHGACAAPLFDALLNGNGTLADTAAAQPVYFSTAMRLHERWDINVRLGLMKRAGCGGVGVWVQARLQMYSWRCVLRAERRSPPAWPVIGRPQEALVRQGFNPLSATSATAAQVRAGGTAAVAPLWRPASGARWLPAGLPADLPGALRLPISQPHNTYLCRVLGGVHPEWLVWAACLVGAGGGPAAQAVERDHRRHLRRRVREEGRRRARARPAAGPWAAQRCWPPWAH